MSDVEQNDYKSDDDLPSDVEELSDIDVSDAENDNVDDLQEDLDNPQLKDDDDNLLQIPSNSYQDNDDDDDYDECDERFDKLSEATQYYHNKHNVLSYDEIKPLLIVKRDKYNNIIDSYHRTIPILTKYEKTKIIGLRSVQLANGLKPFVEVPTDIIDPVVIAEMELKEKLLPFIVKRPISLTDFEYWPLKELEII